MGRLGCTWLCERAPRDFAPIRIVNILAVVRDDLIELLFFSPAVYDILLRLEV